MRPLPEGCKLTGDPARIDTVAAHACLTRSYVLEDHRGRGLPDWLDNHPELQGLRCRALLTQDAQDLYVAHGWSVYPLPERMMTRDDPQVYA